MYQVPLQQGEEEGLQRERVGPGDQEEVEDHLDLHRGQQALLHIRLQVRMIILRTATLF